MQPTIRPPKDRLFIQKDNAEEVTAGGIIIPDMAKKLSSKGTVLAVGKDVREDIEPGDKVIFGKFAGHQTTLDGDKFCWVFEEGDILGKVEEDG